MTPSEFYVIIGINVSFAVLAIIIFFIVIKKASKKQNSGGNEHKKAPVSDFIVNIAKMLSGKDGMLSLKRVTAATFLGLLFRYLTVNPNPDWKVVSVLGLIPTLLLGFITVENIIVIIKAARNDE